MNRQRRPNVLRTQRKAERREALLDAAARTIRERGAGVSMDDIAAEAAITKPILYRHFGDRRGLTAALGERFAAELDERLRAVLTAPGPPRDILARTIDTYLGVIEEDTNLYWFLLHASGGGEAVSLSAFVRQIGQQVAFVLGEQLRANGLDSGAAEPWAYGIVGMVHQAGDWWIEHRSMPRSRLVEYLTSLLWSGLFGQPATKSDELEVTA